jgi:hypothetical protein
VCGEEERRKRVGGGDVERERCDVEERILNLPPLDAAAEVEVESRVRDALMGLRGN